jgi:hypothetical protein
MANTRHEAKEILRNIALKLLNETADTQAHFPGQNQGRSRGS